MRITILSIFLFTFVTRAETVVNNSGSPNQAPNVDVSDPKSWVNTGPPTEEQIKLNSDPQNLDELNEAIRAQGRRDYAEQLREFMEKVRNKVQDHASDTKVVSFGKFKITIQNSCDLGIDPYKPPAAPTHMEKDCVKGQVNATAMAQLVMQAVSKNPPSPAELEASISDCKIEVSWVKKFKIYENCFDGELPEQYSKLYDSFMSTLTEGGKWENTSNGWKTDDEGNRVMNFKKTGEKTTVDLEKFVNESRNTGDLVDANRIPQVVQDDFGTVDNVASVDPDVVPDSSDVAQTTTQQNNNSSNANTVAQAQTQGFDSSGDLATALSGITVSSTGASQIDASTTNALLNTGF